MTPKEYIDDAKQDFGQVGCRLSYDPKTRMVTAITALNQRRYVLPELLPANQERVPGWFLAGIWDDMELSSVLTGLDASYLTGWGFVKPYGSHVWLKSLPHDDSKVLIYHYDGFYIADAERNYSAEGRIPNADDRAALFPGRSVYHVLRLMEEEGWFSEQESAMPSQDIDFYRRSMAS